MGRRSLGAPLGLLCALLLAGGRGAAAPGPGAASDREKELEGSRRWPTGVIPLLRFAGLFDLVAPEEIERLLALAEEKKSNPLVRGYGVYLRSLWEKRSGRLEEAARLRAHAGFITDWMLLGPFDSTDERGLDHEYPPEKELASWPDAKRAYPGKGQGVAWRRLPCRLEDARVPIGAFLDPNREAVAYLHATVRATRAREAALRIGSDGPYRVYLDGVQVASRDVNRPARVDQDAIAVSLRAGLTRIVVKSVAGKSGWSLFARLTEPGGLPLEGISTEALPSPPLPPAPAAAVAAKRGRRATVVDLAAVVRAAAEKRPGDLAALKDRALLEHRLHPEDLSTRPDELAAKAYAEKAKTAAAYLILAEASRDATGELSAVEQALRAEPRSPRALRRAGEIRLREGRIAEAVRLLEEALRASPGYQLAQQKLAGAYRTAGLPHLAAKELDVLRASHPNLGAPLLERADLALAEDDTVLAARLYAEYLSRRQDASSVRRTLAEILLRQKRPAEALAQIETAIRTSPEDLFLLEERARLLEGMGRSEEALAAYRKASEHSPRSTRVIEETGRLLLRLGRRAPALAELKRSLEIHPQNPELRRFISLLSAQKPRGLVERYRVPPEPLITAARSEGSRGESGVLLLNLTATEVHPSGLSRTLHQRLFLVGDHGGATAASRFVIPYQPDRQSVEVRAAKIHRAGGSVETASESHQNLGRGDRIYYDIQGKVLQFDDLKPGDIVEAEYTLDDVAKDNLFADYFGEIIVLEGPFPTRRLEIALVTPKSRSFYFRPPKTGRIVRNESVERDRRIYRFTARDLPKIVSEPRMPGLTEVSDYLHVSTFSKWEEMARWYHGLVKDQVRPTREITETARGLAKDREAPELDRIRAIHNFVAKKTRYLGLEFGIHGYKPYPASQVLERKFGDCKDKATLLVSLLGEVGVAAHLVVLRTRPKGDLDGWPASLASFDHAIAYVPSQKLYLDGTAEFSGTRELPWQDQGATALHIDGGAGSLVRIPTSRAEANRREQRLRIELSPSGEARVSEERRIEGVEASFWRSSYQSADQRRERYEKFVNAGKGWAGARVVSFSTPAIEDLERPVESRAEISVPALAQRDGERRLTVPVLGREFEIVDEFASLSTRKHPLTIVYPVLLAKEVRIVPPKGWRFPELPAARTVREDLSSCTRSSRLDGGDLVTRFEVRIEAEGGRVPPTRYPAFRRLILRIDEIGSEKVTLER
jgi:cellulose synthase operon protein C